LSTASLADKVITMTAAAAQVLKEFEALDPQDQLLVRNQLLSTTQQRQREALERLRGSGKGEKLVERLLKDRAEERARG
jgi:hypothetical protein